MIQQPAIQLPWRPAGQNMAGSASEPVAVMAPGHLTMANGLLTNGMSANGLAPLQNQPHSLLSAPQLETTFAPRPPLAPAMPTVVLPSEDQPPSEMLKAQAETLKVSLLYFIGHVSSCHLIVSINCSCHQGMMYMMNIVAYGLMWSLILN